MSLKLSIGLGFKHHQTRSGGYMTVPTVLTDINGVVFTDENGVVLTHGTKRVRLLTPDVSPVVAYATADGAFYSTADGNIYSTGVA